MKIIIEVDDSRQGKALLQFLSQLSFVRIKRKDGHSRKASKKINELFGIWKDRDISKDWLREKAWRT